MSLIDADALKDEVMKIWAYIQCITGADVMDAVMTDIKNAPTVDTVRVVRCKDCIHNNSCTWSEPDWFCADGERR